MGLLPSSATFKLTVAFKEKQKQQINLFSAEFYVNYLWEKGKIWILSIPWSSFPNEFEEGIEYKFAKLEGIFPQAREFFTLLGDI